MDTRGRVGIPKLYRTQLGLRRKVLVINAGDHLQLMPVALDPIRALRGVFTDKKSFRELRAEAEAEAQKEARKRMRAFRHIRKR